MSHTDLNAELKDRLLTKLWACIALYASGGGDATFNLRNVFYIY